MNVSGYWYSAERSQRHKATLVATGKHYQLFVAAREFAATNLTSSAVTESDLDRSDLSALELTTPELEEPMQAAQTRGLLSDLGFSDRIGDIPRKVSWPDGAVLESTENDRIDQLLASVGHKDGRSHIIHRLERSGRFALFSVLVAAFFGLVFLKWGIPLAAKHIAYRMPVSLHESISSSTFDTLDKYLLDASELDSQRQAAISTRFDRLATSLPQQEFDYRLYFREMNGIANAFALPSGQIVVTDAMVEMIEEPEELDSILLHEIGHVEQRHGLQAVIRGSALSVIAGLVIGDVSGLAQIIAGLPVFLAESSYSRDSEASADAFSFSNMVKLDMDPAHFSTIMRRMAGLAENSAKASSTPDRNQEQIPSAGQKAGLDDDQEGDDEPVSEYFSSHPDSAARAENALEYSRRHYKQH